MTAEVWLLPKNRCSGAAEAEEDRSKVIRRKQTNCFMICGYSGRDGGSPENFSVVCSAIGEIIACSEKKVKRSAKLLNA